MNSLIKNSGILTALLFLVAFSYAEEPLTSHVEKKSLHEGLYELALDEGTYELALGLFAKSAGLNLRLEQVPEGKVNVHFENKNFNDAIGVILEGTDYSWKVENGVLVVGEPKAQILNKKQSLIVEGTSSWRMFTISYPRFKRKGAGASQANISTSGSGEAGSVALTSEDEIIFWEELETQLSGMLQEKSVLTINKTSGVIFLKSSADEMNMVQRFLERVVPLATQQVEITAQIYEVTLNDDFSLGVDWTEVSRIIDVDGTDLTLGLGTSNVKTGPSYKAPSVQANAGFLTSTGNLSTVITAMKEQGDVKVVSQPKIVTLNNQPALVKVGTDFPYFSATVSVNPETGVKDVVEEANIVTLGVVLSLTPQVSEDGWITLGIDPMVTDLVTTTTSSNGSTAPVVDVKQSSSMVRLKDREMVAISGLIQDKKIEEERGVPLLSEIPFLGSLFKWTYKSKVKKELVIFLTPRIL
jgi:MSHA biogenesis protein MshL